MKGKVKANTVDRYLRPIREQVVKLVDPNSSVMEYGCGNGDLLIKLSSKISKGVGIDHSKQLIEYAKDRVEKEQPSNLEFILVDLLKEEYQETQNDYAIASLLHHVLPWENSVELTEKMIASAKTTIICGFSKPENFKQKLLLWLDQRFNKHYSNYREFSKNGYTEELLNSIQDIEYSKIDTFDPVIKIYTITKHSKV